MFIQSLKRAMLIIAVIFSTAALSRGEQKLTEAYFSPRKGPEVFERMYKEISEADKFVHISILHMFTQSCYTLLNLVEYQLNGNR